MSLIVILDSAMLVLTIILVLPGGAFSNTLYLKFICLFLDILPVTVTFLKKKLYLTDPLEVFASAGARL